MKTSSSFVVKSEVFQTPSDLPLSGYTKSTIKKAEDNVRTKEVNEVGSEVQAGSWTSLKKDNHSSSGSYPKLP